MTKLKNLFTATAAFFAMSIPAANATLTTTTTTLANEKVKCATPFTTMNFMASTNNVCASAISALVGQGLDETEPGGTLSGSEQFSIIFTVVKNDSGGGECFSATIRVTKPDGSALVGRGDTDASCQQLMQACNVTISDVLNKTGACSGAPPIVP